MKLDGFKVAIYVDHDNLVHGSDRRGIDYSKLVDFIEDKGMQIVRATVYMAVDFTAEKANETLRTKNQDYRNKIRKDGFRVVEKRLMRYQDEDTKEITVKGNVDLDLAVDALTQSGSADYVLLFSGDGDFEPMVKALQNLGKRVEGMAFRRYSSRLVSALDGFYTGGDIAHFWTENADCDNESEEKSETAAQPKPIAPKSSLVTPVKSKVHPDAGLSKKSAAKIAKRTAMSNMANAKPERHRGKIFNFNIDSGFGFITPDSELSKPNRERDNVYFHVTSVQDAYYQDVSNFDIEEYMMKNGWLEYELGRNQQGWVATNVRFMEGN